MKQAQAGEHERAAANATLLAVMRRMASPLRHDLAGALLIPSLRLQMLRRQLGAATLARERLQAMVDEVIAALDAATGRHQVVQSGQFLDAEAERQTQLAQVAIGTGRLDDGQRNFLIQRLCPCHGEPAFA